MTLLAISLPLAMPAPTSTSAPVQEPVTLYLSATPWYNACEGHHNGGKNPILGRQKILHALNKTARIQLTKLRRVSPNITRDIKKWSLHRRIYNFLPKFNGTFYNAFFQHLPRLHREMQVYTAYFSGIRDNFCLNGVPKRQYSKSKCSEVKKLQPVAKRMLCEIETAMNATSSQHAAATPPHKYKFKIISQEVMQKKLKYSLKEDLDLLFAKHRFMKYLRNLLKKLKNRMNKAKKTRSRQIASEPDTPKLQVFRLPANLA